MSQELKNLSNQMIPALELELRSVMQYPGDPSDSFLGMLHYHMGWVDADFQPVETHAGKRIRPLLTMLAAQAAGGQWVNALPAAASVEILHNFSLVHDDIEDASPTRRGRLTMWKIWGQPQAINTGDAMFALSHMALNRLIDCAVPPANVILAMRRFDDTCLALTRGQYADMSFEDRETVKVNEYIEMIQGKTAVLLALCAELGALVAGSPPTTTQHYAAFGLNLGLAFQVIDDILGIWGNEEKTGKSAASDIITKKKTLPILYGLEKSKKMQELYQNSEPDTTFVKDVITQLDKLGAQDFANEKAQTYSNKALNHLSAAQPQGEAATALYQLADMLLNRDF